MKPKYDHRIIRKFDYTPAVQTNISKTIAREKLRLRSQAERDAAVKSEQAAKVAPIKVA